MLFPFFILFVFSFLQVFTEVVFKFRSSMAELHGPGSTESRYAPEPYVKRIDKFIGDLYYFYQYILDESEWCCGKPGLFDLPQNIVPVKAIPGKATPVKAMPWRPPVPKKGLLKTLRKLLLPLLLKILLLKKHRPKNLLLLFRKLW